MNPEEAKAQNVRFATNQFVMKIGKKCPTMYQYPLRIENTEEVDETLKYTTFELEKIAAKLRRKLEVVLGTYMQHGQCVWTTQQLTETYYFDAKWAGASIKVKVDHTGEYLINPSDIDSPDRASSQAMSQIVNVIVNQAMSETGLLQFGHRPRFFDASDPMCVPELDM